MTNHQYDVALSYASEDKVLVSTVNKLLKENDLRVFFAPEKQSEIVGLDLERALYKIYGKKARYVAVFVSRHYVLKKATMHEANTANSRVRHDDFCIIPIYIDGTRLPNLDANIVYLKSDDVYEITDLITDIVKKREYNQPDVDNDGPKQPKSHNEACLPAGNINISISGGSGARNVTGIDQSVKINSSYPKEG